MTPERWQRIRVIYEAVADLDHSISFAAAAVFNGGPDLRPGTTLASRLTMRPLPLQLADALTHAEEIAGALAHAHRHRIGALDVVVDRCPARPRTNGGMAPTLSGGAGAGRARGTVEWTLAAGAAAEGDLR